MYYMCYFSSVDHYLRVLIINSFYGTVCESLVVGIYIYKLVSNQTLTEWYETSCIVVEKSHTLRCSRWPIIRLTFRHIYLTEFMVAGV